MSALSKHFNVVSTLHFGWYDVATWENVKPTLKQCCIFLTLEFTTSNNVESMLCISTLIWTMLGNVKTTLSFSQSNFTTLVNVETTLWKWPFIETTKQIISNRIRRIRSLNSYFIFIIFFTLLSMLRYVEEYLQSHENLIKYKKLAWIVKQRRSWTMWKS